MCIFWSRFVYVAIYGYLYKSGLMVLLNYFRLCICVCWVYGSATLPGTSHYLDRGKGMLALRGVRGVTSPFELVSEQGSARSILVEAGSDKER